MKNQMKERKGITLIGLIVTIIILLILAGVTVMTLTGDNGLLTKAGEAKNTSEKGEIEEQIKLAYNEWKLRKETGETVDLQNTVQTALDKMYYNATVNKQGKAISINVKGYEFTLIDDGTMEEGKLAYLDIADGNIDLYSNGYKQYMGNLQSLNKNGATEYTGKYIITGTTTENVVRVCDEGTYDITIKDLTIDLTHYSTAYYTAFNANRGAKATGCDVKLTLENNNYLFGSWGAPGLGFVWARPNVDGETNGSTLTIQGNGSLESKNLGWGAGIGSGYSGFEGCNGRASNIIINSGNITAIGGTHGAALGGALNKNADNIIINGGNIELIPGSTYGVGIGSTGEGKANNIKINGGYIYNRGCIGGNSCSKVMIRGGTIMTTSTICPGISCDEDGSISIKGGNVLSRGKNNLNIATKEEGTSNLVAYVPTDGTNNLYETQIKLQGVEENKKVTKLTTSDNIEYGINDMYTLENGMLYLYLPTGTRTITIEVDGKTYSGAVQTTETPAEVILNEIN